MQLTTLLTALLISVPLLIAADDSPIKCVKVDPIIDSEWKREEPVYKQFDLQAVYKASRSNDYHGHDYTISASVDLAYNAYISCESAHGKDRQFMVSFRGDQNKDLGSYWISKGVSCIIPQAIKRADVKSIISRERR